VYGGLIDTLVIDDADAALAAAVEAMNVRAVVVPTLMTGPDATASLGRRIAEEITVRR
jgi:hypothetical protein